MTKMKKKIVPNFLDVICHVKTTLLVITTLLLYMRKFSSQCSGDLYNASTDLGNQAVITP